MMMVCFAHRPALSLGEPVAVRDAEYRVVGYLDRQRDKTFVRDCNCMLLGYSDARGTYDPSGKKLYAQPVPDLLLERSPCRKKSSTPK